jgi:hypothetical protein
VQLTDSCPPAVGRTGASPVRQPGNGPHHCRKPCSAHDPAFRDDTTLLGCRSAVSDDADSGRRSWLYTTHLRVGVSTHSPRPFDLRIPVAAFFATVIHP